MGKHFEKYQFDSGNDGPHVLITAGVHGDEYEPIVAAQQLVKEIPSLLRRGTLTIVPIVNESAHQRNSRCGEDDLDLARTCPGTSDGMLTEQVAFEVSELIKHSDYYVDLHTGGKIFDIYPLAGYMLHDSQGVLETQRKMAEAFGLPVIWGTDSRAEGRTLSVARDANVPAIYVEYGGPDPISSKIVTAYADGCMRILSLLSMLDPQEKPGGNKFLYWVDDYRLNNGHLQAKTPSPVDGVFLPSVEPGNVVRAGDLWGIVQDALTTSQMEIKVEADGLVLFTRVKGAVKKHDSLGGLLPITEPGKIIFHED